MFKHFVYNFVLTLHYEGEKTDNYMGVTEMIVSTSLCGMLFSVFAGQPLIILGGTGPVLIFEEYLYKVDMVNCLGRIIKGIL